MTNEEIRLAWERAERMADRIWVAYVTGTGREQARKDQKNLAHWLGMVKEYGLVYNGIFDECLTLVI